MTKPAIYLQLDCSVQLPERLEHVRGGCFKYNESDYSYASDQYPQIRIDPISCSDGYIWIFYLQNGNSNERLWTRTYYASECNGWLALLSGRCASQAWYVGEYPSTPYYVPMRFIDASATMMIKQVDAVSSPKPISDLIAQLTKSFIDMREDNKKSVLDNQEKQETIFKALSQRHETDMQAVLNHNAKIATESFSMVEKHVAEALSSQSSSLEEKSKIHSDAVRMQMEKLEQAMQNESTFRDTVYTEHELGIEKRLQDMESRASDQQEKLGQDLVAQKEKIVDVKEHVHTLEKKSEDMKETVGDLVGKVSSIEDNLKDNIVQTIMELVRRQRGSQLQLANGDVIQLLGSPQPVAVKDEVEEPIWDDGEEPEVEFVDKSDVENEEVKDASDAEAGEKDNNTSPDDTKREERSLTPLQRRSKRSRTPIQRRHCYWPDIRDTRRSSASCSCPPYDKRWR